MSNLATQRPDPPSPPPPPISPPPFFDNAEDCIPLPTASFFGIETERVTENSDPFEERALCVFLKAVKEESMPADRCFAEMASPKPPPPPPAGGLESAQNMINELENERIAGDYGVKNAAGLSEEDHLAAEIRESLAETHALIASFGETAPVLRDLLTRSAEEMENSIVAARDASASAIEGRRLMSRRFEFDTKLTDVLVDHEIQKDQYADGVPGIDKLSCETLCSAVTEQNASRACKAIVFKRQYPFSRTDRTGRCYLLKSAGSCFGRDFGAQLLTRQIDSENVCEEIAPGLHDTACISLPASRDDLRVLSHKDATDMAAVTPANAPTSAGKLPLPRTVLEAMSLVAFARQLGVYAFWLRSPDSEGEVVVPIITAGGDEFDLPRDRDPMHPGVERDIDRVDGNVRVAASVWCPPRGRTGGRRSVDRTTPASRNRRPRAASLCATAAFLQGDRDVDLETRQHRSGDEDRLLRRGGRGEGASGHLRDRAARLGSVSLHSWRRHDFAAVLPHLFPLLRRVSHRGGGRRLLQQLQTW